MSAFAPVQCPSCAEFIDWREGAPGEPMACPGCGWAIQIPLEPPPNPNPWEGREGSAFRRWWRTCDRALYHPHSFFPAMPPRGGHSAPIRFVVSFYLQFFLILAVWIPVSNAFKGTVPFTTGLAVLIGLGVPFVCGLATAVLYLVAFLVHLCVRALGGKGPFEGTLRVYAYTFPLLIFRFVPWVGRFLHPLWSLACHTFGLAAVHRISKKKAFLGALLGEALVFGILLYTSLVLVVFVFALLKGVLAIAT